MGRLERRYERMKYVAVFTAGITLLQAIYPTAAYGLTAGPSQPEVQGFEPIGTTDMVDPFTGDFTYNIPLFDVGGYPVNLSYHSGITMDDEASWVGLGWSLNPGAITRNLRGLPDDFNGDEIKNTTNLRENRTWAVNVETDLEVFGKETKTVNAPGDTSSVTNFPLRLGLGVQYNNYRGFGLSLDISISPGFLADKLSAINSIDLSANSQSGVSANVNFPVTLGQIAKKSDVVGSFGAGFNSRAGLQELSFNTQLKRYESKKKTFDRKKDKVMGSDALSASIDFVGPTYIPYQSSSFRTFSLAVSGKLGGELIGFMPNAKFTASYSNQKLHSRMEKGNAFGYYYLQGRSPGSEVDKTAILDFNREKDGPFTKNTPNLPLTNLTYDIYSVSGQGLSGTVRPHRTDHGYVYDAARKTVSHSGSVGIDIGAAPNLGKLGANGQYVRSSSNSGLWDKKNDARPELPFRDRYEVSSTAYKPLYEPTYFSTMGEMTALNSTFASSVKDERPIRIDVQRAGLLTWANDDFVDDNEQFAAMGANYVDDRVDRNQNVSVLTGKEATSHALEKYIKSYGYSSGLSVLEDSFHRVIGPPVALSKSNHFSEFTITKPDGWRYVYGIPAYNNVQHEVTFAVNGDGDCSTGMITYTNQNSPSNQAGKDHYYNKRETPPYAHSFLLTAVLSPDYADVTDNGISPDDNGAAVELKYTRTSSIYQWRFPAGVDKQANFDEGLKTKTGQEGDNKASYIYGEKEQWYLHRIESRTHIAEFYISERDDGLGVEDANGNKSTTASNNRMMKLDSIKLFSRVDLEENGVNAVPIKWVHFVYDYSLCDGITNSDGNNGKLTLKELYFTYGTSFKGKLNSYKFYYGDYDHDGVADASEAIYNPTYNMKGYDRWGSYKPNPSSCNILTGTLPNGDFPYTTQDTVPTTDSQFWEPTDPGRAYADAYAIAWNLTTIDLPSGGSINVDYESDDYAYVQNKQAMRMFKITGFAACPSCTPDAALYSGSAHYEYLIFKLAEDIDVTQVDPDRVLDDYFKGIQDLYFKVLSRIQDFDKDNQLDANEYEWIPGYCEIEQGAYGFVPTGNNVRTHGWARLKKTGLKDNGGGTQVNPITKAGLNFVRMNLPERMYPGSDPKSTGESALRGLLSTLAEVKSFFKNPYDRMLSQQRPFCKEVLVNKSFIRLNDPTFAKKGGGSRVRKITLSDNWADMLNGTTHGETFQYGQEYDYTTTATINGETRTISSGVAAYEPLIGGDENPFRQPRAFDKKLLLAPNEEYFLEEPFGESFFPAASVGYSRVTVRNLQYENVTRTATGYAVHEFYTAKDFPTRPLETDVEALPVLEKPLLSFLKIGIKQKMTASQGYSIEVNDMHGKPKAQWVYAEGQEQPISGVEYKYFTDPVNPRRLSNRVPVVYPDGSTGTEVMGEEIDIVTDFRRNYNQTITGNIQINADGFILGILPLLIPMVWPTGGLVRNEFNSTVTTKVIQRYGILKTTIAHDFGSTITTHNALWDAETGQVLLTQTENEYRDPVYNVTFPAHWVYSGMSAASQNSGMELRHVYIANGVANLSPLNASDYFHAGDEVQLTSSSGYILPMPLTVLDVDAATDEVYLVTPNGYPYKYAADVSLKVLRSGRRNLQSTPIGSVTTLYNPLTTGWNDLDSVINASATTFSDRWQMPCNNPIGCEMECDTVFICGTPMWAVIEELLDTLARGRDFAPIQVPPVPVGLTPYTYCPEFENYNPDMPPHVWDVNSNTTATFVGTFGHGVLSGCQVSLSLPQDFPSDPNLAGYSYEQFWDSIKQFTNIMPGEPGDSCYTGDVYDFTIDVVVPCKGAPVPGPGPESTITIPCTVTVTLDGSTSCYPLLSCTSTYGQCDDLVGMTVNPYVHGIRGNWRPKNTFAFHEDRLPGDSNDIRFAGTIDGFEPYWYESNGNWLASTSPDWVSPAEVTIVTPSGFEVENVDALGNYSSAQYGYARTLPVAVAANAAYRQIGYDGFEDYEFNDGVPCLSDHFSFRDISGVVLTDTAHTGYKGIRVEPGSGNVIDLVRDFTVDTCVAEEDDLPYTVKECDCLGIFEPDRSPTDTLNYVVSYWVHEDHDTVKLDFSDSRIRLRIGSTNLMAASSTRSEIIEGWQRHEWVYKVPPGTSGALTVRLQNLGSVNSYFDDVRIHPFDANMQTYVYHPINLRVIAVLDNNNFATLYEYDQEGNLIRVKKETERGIVTLQESRTSMSKF